KEQPQRGRTSDRPEQGVAAHPGLLLSGAASAAPTAVHSRRPTWRTMVVDDRHQGAGPAPGVVPACAVLVAERTRSASRACAIGPLSASRRRVVTTSRPAPTSMA